MTTALFLLRCMEVGIRVNDLDSLTIGLVIDIWNEKSRDGMDWPQKASQEDMDLF